MRPSAQAGTLIGHQPGTSFYIGGTTRYRSVTCVVAVWKFASYVATLPSERWTRRILEWNIRGPRKRGPPAYTSEKALQRYCIWKGGSNWIVEAAAYDHWMRSVQDFVVFTLYTS